ncbi:MAG: DsrE family protein [Pseudomonadota bacterium]|nr:DsrE family protein [Pseudomonadota bacterium]
MKQLSAFITAAALAVFASASLAQVPVKSQAVATRNRVVMQVSDNDAAKWNLALNNARNLQSDLGPDKVDIEIVVYGPGIGMLKRESPVASRIDEAITAGVAVVACENTMAGAKLTKPDMLPHIGFVPAGVVELMQKQQQGYAYIRP